MSGTDTEFALTLERLRLKAKKSRYRLAQWSGLSETYLLRLETGERARPGRDVVLLISLALVSDSPALGIFDIEDLMLSAGYAPLRKRGEPESQSFEGSSFQGRRDKHWERGQTEGLPSRMNTSGKCAREL